MIGVHVNALVTYPVGAEGELDGLTETEQQRLAAMGSYNDGYLQIQAKSPHTLAYGLHDSPAGQLAWMVEMFQRLTDHPADGMPEDAIGIDRMLSAVTLYWLTGTGGSAAQVYYEDITANAWSSGAGEWGEAASDDAAGSDDWTTAELGAVPTGVLVSTRDITIRRFAEREHNVVHWSEYDQGGHFFATEQPHLFANDVRAFFRKVR